jgi:hypothetical protein
MKKAELKDLKKADLEKKAKDLGIKVGAGMSKEDIIDQIVKVTKQSDGKGAKKKDDVKPLKQTKLNGISDTMKGESKKFEIEDKRGYVEPTYELVGDETYVLPPEYGDTKITLLVQDPYWMHAYWEINDEARKKFKIERGKHNVPMAIRVYNASTKESFDVEINDNARSWYFKIPIAGLPFYAELGLKDAKGKFVVIAQSNTVNVPTDKPSEVIDEKWISKEDRAKAEELFKRSGGYIIHKLVGSQSMTEWMMSPNSVSSAGSFGAGSGSGGVAAKKLPVQKGRKFWAELHTELIVYGATEPDAIASVGGVPIKLSPNGTFSVRFYLKDGDHSVPFIATSRDEVDTIEITPFVVKRTERVERKNKPE